MVDPVAEDRTVEATVSLGGVLAAERFHSTTTR
jgi:hypothetical protein